MRIPEVCQRHAKWLAARVKRYYLLHMTAFLARAGCIIFPDIFQFPRWHLWVFLRPKLMRFFINIHANCGHHCWLLFLSYILYSMPCFFPLSVVSYILQHFSSAPPSPPKHTHFSTVICEGKGGTLISHFTSKAPNSSPHHVRYLHYHFSSHYPMLVSYSACCIFTRSELPVTFQRYFYRTV